MYFVRIKWAVMFSVCSCSLKVTTDVSGFSIQQLLFPVPVWMNLLAASLVLRMTLVMSSQACESAVGGVVYVY